MDLNKLHRAAAKPAAWMGAYSTSPPEREKIGLCAVIDERRREISTLRAIVQLINRARRLWGKIGVEKIQRVEVAEAGDSAAPHYKMVARNRPSLWYRTLELDRSLQLRSRKVIRFRLASAAPVRRPR